MVVPTIFQAFPPLTFRSGSLGAYAGAVRRRVHLATVLLRPPSGHRPGRRQARHVHILQIGLRLAIAQAHASPLNCKNEYMVLALAEQTAAQAVVGSIVWAFHRLKKQGFGRCAPAATRVVAYGPQFSLFLPS